MQYNSNALCWYSPRHLISCWTTFAIIVEAGALVSIIYLPGMKDGCSLTFPATSPHHIISHHVVAICIAAHIKRDRAKTSSCAETPSSELADEPICLFILCMWVIFEANAMLLPWIRDSSYLIEIYHPVFEYK